MTTTRNATRCIIGLRYRIPLAPTHLSLCDAGLYRDCHRRRRRRGTTDDLIHRVTPEHEANLCGLRKTQLYHIMRAGRDAKARRRRPRRGPLAAGIHSAAGQDNDRDPFAF